MMNNDLISRTAALEAVEKASQNRKDIAESEVFAVVYRAIYNLPAIEHEDKQCS